MNQEDLDRIADTLDRAAELLRKGRAVTALERAAAWRGNLRAANYDPSSRSGHRHDVYDEAGDTVVVAVPNDPTGEARTTTVDHLRHPRLVAAIGALSQAAGVAVELIVDTVPDAPAAVEDEGPGDGWCRSCYRDKRYLEPEATHRNGTVKHRGACTWCASFKAEHGIDPPLELLRKRHGGRRITVADVTAALARTQPTGARAKKRRRKSR